MVIQLSIWYNIPEERRAHLYTLFKCAVRFDKRTIPNGIILSQTYSVRVAAGAVPFHFVQRNSKNKGGDSKWRFIISMQKLLREEEDKIH